MEREQEKGGIFFGMWGVFKRRTWLLLFVAALFEIPGRALSIFWDGREFGPHNLGGDLLDLLFHGLGVCALIMIALAPFRKEVGESEGPSNRLLRYLLFSLAAYFLMLGGVAFGLALLVVPGIIVALRWSVSVPIAAFEGVGPQEALVRSFRMTRGFMLDIFLGYFLLALIITVPGLPLVFFKKLIPGSEVLLGALSAASSVFSACFSVGLFRFLKSYCPAGTEPGTLSLAEPVEEH